MLGQNIYDLTLVPSFVNFITKNQKDIEQEKYYSINEYFTKANEKYTIVRYNKDFLYSELISTYGLLRSVILSGNKIVSFAPPKSISADSFMLHYPNKTDNIVAEEFVEGTMINVFYDNTYGVNGCWQIATRNTVGGEVSFYKSSKKTFNEMFIEACVANKLYIQTLNPDFCYSFVMQHPDNRIVAPFKNPQLYLVEVYKIQQNENDIKIYRQDMNLVKQYGFWCYTTIKFAENYEFNTYSEIINKFASANTPYNVLGVVVKNLATGERMKIRNPIYEEVRQLRGNQPKLQYQYLCLRQSGKIAEFLKYYPETKSQMSSYREQVHMFTNTLHKNYISCYIKKEKALSEFPTQYKTHMYKIHEHYLSNLKQNNLYVTNTVVINYVNKLHPSLLMYCLNHNIRKRLIDTRKQL